MPDFTTKLKELMGVPKSEEDVLLEFSNLAKLREGASKEEQNRLAPLEHGKYTEGVVTENPLQAIPMSLAIPAYTTGKAVGAIKARSDPSWEEVSQAYKGIGRGLYNAMFGEKGKQIETK